MKVASPPTCFDCGHDLEDCPITEAWTCINSDCDNEEVM